MAKTLEDTNMKKITAENFDELYVDKIELAEIDKFVCNEMSRQIHRYIKGMSGSKTIMLKFEESLSKLSIPEKEQAIARYIDLNRKAISGLDWKMVIIRAAANYCDTYSYWHQMINSPRKIVPICNASRKNTSNSMKCLRKTESLASKTTRGTSSFIRSTISFAHLMSMSMTSA